MFGWENFVRVFDELGTKGRVRFFCWFSYCGKSGVVVLTFGFLNGRIIALNKVVES